MDEELVKNLKCCGNCAAASYGHDMELICERDKMNKLAENCCSDWQSDNLTAEERRVK